LSSGNTSWFDKAADPPSPEETQTLLVDVAATQIIRTDAKKPDASKPDGSRSDAGKPERSRPDAGKPDAKRPDVTKPEVKTPEVKTPEAAVEPEAERPKADAEVPKADSSRLKSEAARPNDDAPRPKNNPLRLKLDVARPKAVGGPDQTQVLLTSMPAESSETRIIRTDAPAKKPVFVDATGRRGKRVRMAAYGIALAVLIAVAAVWVSQFDSWAKPPAPATSGVTK
jgi:hypothetical protein